MWQFARLYPILFGIRPPERGPFGEETPLKLVQSWQMANGAVLMVEILLNTRTGAPTAADYGAREGARSVAPAPQAQAGLLNTKTFVQQIVPVLAPDVLLAAQQNRDISRVRTFDARHANASYRQPQADERTQTTSDAPNPAQFTAEIIPLRTSRSAFFTDTQATQAHAFPASGAQFRRANQAYVQAGAADGRSFAASGLDTASRQALSRPVNLII